MSVYPIPVTKMPSVIIRLVHILVSATKDFLVMDVLAQVSWSKVIIFFIPEKCVSQFGFAGSSHEAVSSILYVAIVSSEAASVSDTFCGIHEIYANIFRKRWFFFQPRTQALFCAPSCPLGKDPGMGWSRACLK